MEDLWIKDNQKHLQSLPRYQQIDNELRIYKDETGYLRCCGRLTGAPVNLSAREPILLSSNHRLTDLTIEQAHQAQWSKTLTEIRTLLFINRIFIYRIKHFKNLQFLLSVCVLCIN